MASVGSIYFDRVSQIRMDRWTKGRTALVGDAAACVSLMAGEGTGLAMAEAYVLAGELRNCGGDYGAAFARYRAADDAVSEAQAGIGGEIRFVICPEDGVRHYFPQPGHAADCGCRSWWISSSAAKCVMRSSSPTMGSDGKVAAMGTRKAAIADSQAEPSATPDRAAGLVSRGIKALRAAPAGELGRCAASVGSTCLVAICTHGKQIITAVAVTRVSDHAASKASRPDSVRGTVLASPFRVP